MAQAINDGTAELQNQGVEAEARGLQLTLESSAGFVLKLESLENRTAGIRLLQAWTRNQVQRAVVFVPRTAFGLLSDRIRQYENENTPQGAPRNRLLVESIDRIRLAIAEDLSFHGGAVFFTKSLNEAGPGVSNRVQPVARHPIVPSGPCLVNRDVPLAKNGLRKFLFPASAANASASARNFARSA